MQTKDRIEYPAVPPVAPGVRRPFWSVMIPAHDSAGYLEKALKSVLERDPGFDEMQIEVIDDCSQTDEAERLTRRIGKGRVSFYRNAKNAGPYGNFNICIRRSAGRMVHILNSDDYVENNFYGAMRRLIDGFPAAALYACRGFIVDEHGQIDYLSERLKPLENGSDDPAPFFYGNNFLSSGIVVRREFYERYGGFYEGLPHTADWELAVRVISKSSGVSVNKPLVCYRQHTASHSYGEKKTARNLEDCMKLGGIFSSLYPGFDKEKFRKTISGLAFNQALDFWNARDRASAMHSGLFWRRNARLRDKLLKLYESLMCKKKLDIVLGSVLGK